MTKTNDCIADKNFVPDASRYAGTLGAFIRFRTISDDRFYDETQFSGFLKYVETRFENIFSQGEYTDFNGGIMIRIKGRDEKSPLVLMSHYDVVPENGKWSFDAWSGEVRDGVVYGRGAVDTKGSLSAIFESVESLLKEGFTFLHDLYIVSSSREEIAGNDVPEMVKYLKDKGVRPKLVIDEGGGIVDAPVPGTKGKFAMLGMIERSSARLLLEAKGTSGVSAAEKLAKFVLATGKRKFGKRDFGPVNEAMFKAMTPQMSAPVRFIFSHLNIFKPLLIKLLPKVEKSAAGLLGATIAFSSPRDDETKDTPSGAQRMILRASGNYYNKIDDLIEEITALAKKYDVSVKVLAERETPPPEPLDSDGYNFVKGVAEDVFGDVTVCPFCVLGGTDARHFIGVGESVIRFAPIYMNKQQFGSFHNTDENIFVDSIVGAVRFYRETICRFNSSDNK